MDAAASVVPDELVDRIAGHALAQLAAYRRRAVEDAGRGTAIGLRGVVAQPRSPLGEPPRDARAGLAGLVQDLTMLAGRTETLRRNRLGRPVSVASPTGAWWLPAATDDRRASAAGRAMPRISRHAIDDLVARIRDGDPTAESELLSIAWTAIRRYCRAVELLGQASRWVTQRACRQATDEVRSLIRANSHHGSSELLAAICEVAERSVRDVSISERTFHHGQLRRQWWSSPPVERDGCDEGRYVSDRLKDSVRRLPGELQRVFVLRAMVGLGVEATARVFSRDVEAVIRMQSCVMSRLCRDVAESPPSTSADDGPWLDEVGQELGLISARVWDTDDLALSGACC
ncbi:MAG TPA: hypothetical protein VGD67_08680 [Pseudonocardiaceae bacterium]